MNSSVYSEKESLSCRCCSEACRQISRSFGSKKHIENRELASITGVKDVGSFNESMVVLMTEGGGLTVEGTELHITKLNLDEGQVIIEGQIIAFEYDDVPVQRGSFFSRMFR